jgi:hypothetical protein
MRADRPSPYRFGAPLLAALPLAALLLAGCASEEAPSPFSPTQLQSEPPDMPYAPCASEQQVGEFTIERGPDYTSVDGKVYDAITPNSVAQLLASEQECQLLSLPTFTCNPACAVSTETCGSDGLCMPLPLPRTVGAVHVTGMVVPVELTANAITGAYRPRGAQLPHPGFDPGAELALQASGGDFNAFELWGWGIFPLTEVDVPVYVSAGAPTALGWSAPEAAGPGRMHVSLNVNNHGRNNAWIECDFADDGAAEIPAGLIDALLVMGQSGFPTVTFSRRTVTSSELDWGCVQLVVSSTVSAGVSQAGLTSCNDSSMCPAGQTCRPLERFCE